MGLDSSALSAIDMNQKSTLFRLSKLVETLHATSPVSLPKPFTHPHHLADSQAWVAKQVSCGGKRLSLSPIDPLVARLLLALAQESKTNDEHREKAEAEDKESAYFWTQWIQSLVQILLLRTLLLQVVDATEQAASTKSTMHRGATDETL